MGGIGGSIVLGTTRQNDKLVPVRMDIDLLLRTRALITGNSGAGKSWLIRLLAEQLFGKVQVIILDPEGEFSTLREKFGFVLVGKGGETPIDVRSAEIVAHRLLELKAPAVCDLYEMKPADRHRWVRVFLEGLINAPKHLWHYLVIIIDEAHVLCPEKGQGESEAYWAMMDLVSRGRKRGFCPIFATQRIAMLSKNVSSLLVNRLVGMTFEDVDLDRAANVLSVTKEEKREFCKSLKLLETGDFWGFGRAISKDRILIDVGAVQTTHPEMGSSKHAAEVPPAPKDVQKLLPQLQDLPKEAETKAKTEQEMRAEIAELKRQVAAKPVPAPPPAPKPVQPEKIPFFKKGDFERMEKLSQKISAINCEARNNSNHALETEKRVGQKLEKVDETLEKIEVLTHEIRCRLAAAAGYQYDKDGGRHAIAPTLLPDQCYVPDCPNSPIANTMKGPTCQAHSYVLAPGYQRPLHPVEGHPFTMAHLAAIDPEAEAAKAAETADEGFNLTPGLKEVLVAIMKFKSLGRTTVRRTHVAAIANSSAKSSTFRNKLSLLASNGYILYSDKKSLSITPKGEAAADYVAEVFDREGILRQCKEIMSEKQGLILDLLDRTYPGPVKLQVLAQISNSVSASSSTFRNLVSGLASAEMLERVKVSGEPGAKLPDWIGQAS